MPVHDSSNTLARLGAVTEEVAEEVAKVKADRERYAQQICSLVSRSQARHKELQELLAYAQGLADDSQVSYPTALRRVVERLSAIVGDD